MDFQNYECDGQLDIFTWMNLEYKITKPIKLIELFAGIGSQNAALRDIGAKYESHLAVEIDKYAISAYNAIHGTSYPPMDISKMRGGDLNIKEKDKFCYIMTYSFPCT